MPSHAKPVNVRSRFLAYDGVPALFCAGELARPIVDPDPPRGRSISVPPAFDNGRIRRWMLRRVEEGALMNACEPSGKSSCGSRKSEDDDVLKRGPRRKRSQVINAYPVSRYCHCAAVPSSSDDQPLVRNCLSKGTVSRSGNGN